jgi:riboflavin synthase
MFTGLVEGSGTVAAVAPLGGGIRLQIRAPWAAKQLGVNDSVAVNGCCQTVVRRSSTVFQVVAVEETLRKTTFGALAKGDAVNLELPMRADGRFGGHIVLGHVDTVGTVAEIERRQTSTFFWISVPEKFSPYVVPVGSIAVDGVSLTIEDLDGIRCGVSIIPHTLENTLFGSYKKGTRVNIEFDVLGKYVERLARRTPGLAGAYDEVKLRENGF